MGIWKVVDVQSKSAELFRITHPFSLPAAFALMLDLFRFAEDDVIAAALTLIRKTLALKARGH